MKIHSDDFLKFFAHCEPKDSIFHAYIRDTHSKFFSCDRPTEAEAKAEIERQVKATFADMGVVWVEVSK